jgi:adenine-specific DNA glycosylase
VGSTANVACIYSSLRNCYDSLGQYSKAIKLHELHLTIAEEVGDRAGPGSACGNLGVCYDHDSLGQYDKATKLHEQCQTIAEEVGNPMGAEKFVW